MPLPCQCHCCWARISGSGSPSGRGNGSSSGRGNGSLSGRGSGLGRGWEIEVEETIGIVVVGVFIVIVKGVNGVVVV